MEHKVAPGLYEIGNPQRTSPVLVTANYSLSFDSVRTALHGSDAYVLVLDTKGVNVWCAAGKGTFGTEELIRRVLDTDLSSLVEHRHLILPQLGAPGVAAHEVRVRTGFTVEYGPVRAENIPQYLKDGRATPEMRKVTFTLAERAVLTPVELVLYLKYLLPAMVILFLIGGSIPMLLALTAVLGGTVLFPILLPYLPTKDFASKGIVLGGVLSLIFSLENAMVHPTSPLWAAILYGASLILIVGAVVGYIGLNFTGSTTYTSRTAVKKEIFRWIPIMVCMLVIGAIALISVLMIEAW